MKKLLVLANEFPFGTWESYMEIEEKYYSAFDKIWIASLQLREEHAKTQRNLKSNSTIIPVPYMSRVFYFINCITVLGDKELYSEIKELIKSGRLSLKHIVDLFVFMSRAHHEASVIYRVLKKEDKSDLLLYSYRFEYQPYIALLLKKKWKLPLYIVCRAHGYDLYEEQHVNNYIPLRKFILKNVDYVFPCSEYGVDYINKKYEYGKTYVKCRYLGTVDYGVRISPPDMNPLKILSCSNVVRVKRLDKIVNALSLIHNIEIEWTHYGDGPLLEEIKRSAFDKLGKNIKAIFPGNISNKELLNKYASTDYHIFLNVSSSEGIPVSIMEAMSFGIPCIATNVGGTRELVNNSNGYLLDGNVKDKDIADVICNISTMNIEDYMLLRENARISWQNMFDSDGNYSKFFEDICKMSVNESPKLLR